MILAPGLASGRTPLSGRTPEYLGEDPLLAGTLAAAMVHGFRDNPAEPVESVLKHYVANEQEIDRQTSSSNVDQRTLRQIYTLPYEVAIKKSRPGGVMCAYNQVNGIYSCESANILRQILKEEIGFDGWTRSSTAGASGTPTCSRPRWRPARSPRRTSTTPPSAWSARTSATCRRSQISWRRASAITRRPSSGALGWIPMTLSHAAARLSCPTGLRRLALWSGLGPGTRG